MAGRQLSEMLIKYTNPENPEIKSRAIGGSVAGRKLSEMLIKSTNPENPEIKSRAIGGSGSAQVRGNAWNAEHLKTTTPALAGGGGP